MFFIIVLVFQTRLLLYYMNSLHFSLTEEKQTSHVVVELMTLTNKHPIQ